MEDGEEKEKEEHDTFPPLFISGRGGGDFSSPSSTHLLTLLVYLLKCPEC